MLDRGDYSGYSLPNQTLKGVTKMQVVQDEETLEKLYNDIRRFSVEMRNRYSGMTYQDGLKDMLDFLIGEGDNPCQELLDETKED